MIDLAALHQALSATDNPALPSLSAQYFALRGVWAVVLATGALMLLRRRSYGLQTVVALGLVVCTLLPGNVSPAYWLGLAFVSPSWITLLLCLAWLYQHICKPPVAQPEAPMQLAALGMATCGVMMGWLLLADMLVWLPFTDSVYAWGFSRWAVAVATAIALLPWLVWGTRLVPPDANTLSVLALPAVAVVLFVFTRLPSGNLWDALLDPWLWLVLQAVWLLRFGRYCFQKLVKAMRGAVSEP